MAHLSRVILTSTHEEGNNFSVAGKVKSSYSHNAKDLKMKVCIMMAVMFRQTSGEPGAHV